MEQMSPMLRRSSLDAKSSDAKPMELESPQNRMAFPTEFQTGLKSPF